MNNSYEKKGKSKVLMFILDAFLAIVTSVIVFIAFNLL